MPQTPNELLRTTAQRVVDMLTALPGESGGFSMQRRREIGEAALTTFELLRRLEPASHEQLLLERAFQLGLLHLYDARMSPVKCVSSARVVPTAAAG